MPTAAACACARGAPLAAFVRAVLGRRGWAWRERIAPASGRARWRRAGFRCDARPRRVAELAAAPAGRGATRPDRAAVRGRAQHAGRRSQRARSSCACCATRCSAAAARPTCCCRASASARLLPEPAAGLARSARRRRSARPSASMQLERDGAGWRVDGEHFDRVVLAASAVEAARLVARTRPRGRRRPRPCATSRSSPSTRAAPAARLPRADARAACRRRRTGRRSSSSIAAGSAASAGAARLRDQRRGALGRARHRGHRGGDAGAGETRSWAAFFGAPLELVRTVVEKRATFACTPGLLRPPMDVAPGLLRLRRLRRRPVPGDARRRGPQRRRRGATPRPVDRARIPP